MKMRELKRMVSFGNVKKIILDEFEEGFAICATEPDGHSFIAPWGYWLESELGEVRTYTSIDRAVEMLKGLGYWGKIEIKLDKEKIIKGL